MMSQYENAGSFFIIGICEVEVLEREKYNGDRLKRRENNNENSKEL